MLKKLSELDNFTAWLREQPADQTYNWFDPQQCVMAQFLAPSKQTVLTKPLPDWYERVTQQHPWTFGAALKRAEALQ